ncbi:P-loop NTPase fold protein [Amycolatopsis sp. NPDC024027]|uniref:P-loop NTPase fold protein n=1 Tax=Amycolatopsis sp. NPDC024027 TaxID=3154327 RepID=UPI0033E74083
MRKALLWASGTAALDGNHRPITSDDLFIGLLLAHPDPQGEIWQFLGHFGLTARDVLPDDRPVLDHNALRSAAAAARGPDVSDWSSDVSTIMGEAGERAGGTAQVLHVLASLLGRPPWPQRLQPGLARFGISATELVSEFGNVIPSLRSVDPEQDTDTIDLQSDTTVGEQIGQWLARRFPRQPATMASISNDAPDPSADFVGVGSEADAFAYLITSKTLVPPLAIGLFGTWGSGKSFLMTKIRHRVGQLTTMAAGRSESQEIWSKVVPIEFNAWQYVETDLWAALLSRIYGELSPEARAKLTELGRRRLEQQGEEAANREELVHAREKLEDLVATQEKQVEALRTATEQVTNAKRQADDLAVVRAALDTDARAALRGMAINEVRARLGTEVTAFIEEAHRLKVAASVPAWKHGKFWSRGRTVWVLLATLIMPAVLVVLDRSGLSFPTAVTAALTTCAAALVPVVRAATGFLDRQRKAAEEAERKVAEQLANRVRTAEEKQQKEETAVKNTHNEIETERGKLKKAESQRTKLDDAAARLTHGTVYTDYLSARTVSDDYRKRLGIVSAVSDDLRILSTLVTDYNGTDEAQSPDGPPNRIVLYIDDLDRCPPRRVLEVLEAVHLLLAFPLFVVVVAVDTRWLTEALASALPLLKEKPPPAGDAPTPTDYLEKIFQIPFWVDSLDDDGRHRMLRGLLLPSVAQSRGATVEQSGTALTYTSRERDAADKMLAVYGPWLDRDAQKFTITPAELAFVETLTPLVSGTPRQVKRFVNICKLLLAMSPPLAGGDKPATERTATCFMAAVYQSMPEFAAKLAEAAASAGPEATLATMLAELTEPACGPDRQKVQNWLSQAPPPPPSVLPFDSANAAMFIKRWNLIRRLRFAADRVNEPRSQVP